MIRYLAFALCIAFFLLSLVLGVFWSTYPWWGVAIFGLLTFVGIFDMAQTRSTLRRNYPVLAHFRYGLEEIGPGIRQYIIEDDNQAMPFSRQQRGLVYRRAKGVMDVLPFGTLQDVQAVDYEWINHSLAPTQIASHDFRIHVGGDECTQPYEASLFNISAMSFGALSANAIRSLNDGARRGGFYHDTGEGSISPYHLEHGGDLVWELGSGYFGCRDEQGRFDPERFAASAKLEQVRMIEIKLSQGAKPGHGGVLPAAKVSAEIAATRGVPVGVDCVSPARHSAFSTPLELLQFVARLRELSGGKPVGFKLAIGHPWEWFGIAKAMQESGILPDFIVVDGAEGGTGAAPVEFIDHIGVPLQEALLLVHNTLVGLNLRDRVRVAAAGKITSAFDIAKILALGADWCNAARGFMFALGCIQSLSCHNDRCPTGIATQDPARWKHLDTTDKAGRVHQFHDNTLKAFRDLICAAGLESPSELGPEHILRRVSPVEIRSLAALYHYLEPGELLRKLPEHTVFKNYWVDASADSFTPPAGVSRLRHSKSH